jgi:hypothetical protein
MNGHENPDPRFRAWLSEQAPRRAPDELLDHAMQTLDEVPQGRGWTVRWPVLRFAPQTLAVAAVLVIAVGTGLLLANRPPTVGPGPSGSSVPSTTPAASPTPATGPIPAQVIARIPLPNPQPQTPDTGAFVATSDAIWIVDAARESTLTQIGLATNSVISDVPIDPAILLVEDGRLWMVSPVGGAPGPASYDLSRIDLSTGEPQVVTQIPASSSVAAGLGGVWVADSDLRLLDPDTGEVIRTLPVEGEHRISVACGSLWAWGMPTGPQDLNWSLTRIDPATGAAVIDQIELPDGVQIDLTEIDGLCWTYAGRQLYGVSPTDGLVVTTDVPGTGTLQIAGASVWRTTTDGIVQAIDPHTGLVLGPGWQLPAEDLHKDPKGMPDWRLLSAGGSLWLLSGDQVVRYDIPASGVLPGPTPAPTPSASVEVPTIPSEPTGPILSGQPQSATDDDGTFRLTIRSDQDRYRAGQLIDIGATLTYLGPDSEVIASGPGTGLVGFGLKLEGSAISIGPAFTSDCAPYTFTRDDEVAYPFTKTGGYTPGEPLTPFYEAYFGSPELRLPAGTWTVAVGANFSTSDCSGEWHDLSASLTIVVEP